MPQDDTEAVRLYRLAADQGIAEAQGNLAWMYSEGRGVPKDDAEAVRFFRLAAEQGNSFAQGNLGWMYVRGAGVPQDFILAHMWFNLSAAQGEETAVKNRDLAAARLTPADLSEAQKRARECFASGYKNCD